MAESDNEEDECRVLQPGEPRHEAALAKLTLE